MARNPCIRRLVEEGLGRTVLVPDAPQEVAAIGCSLVAGREAVEGP